MPAVVRESFAVAVDGVMQVYAKGDLVADDDPVTQSHAHLLQQPQARDRSGRVSPPVEQATAVPGEKRRGQVKA